MQANRRARLASVIQQELSVLISRELKDPRVPPLTITQVQVAQDASSAIVYVSLLNLGAEGGQGAQGTKIRACLEGLASASGYLRRQLAPLLEIRHIPSLIFKEDRGAENTARVHELLKSLETAGKTGSSES